MNYPFALYLLGISIVLLTHLFLLGDPAMQMHALVNLVAVGMIVYYFMTSGRLPPLSSVLPFSK